MADACGSARSNYVIGGSEDQRKIAQYLQNLAYSLSLSFSLLALRVLSQQRRDLLYVRSSRASAVKRLRGIIRVMKLASWRKFRSCGQQGEIRFPVRNYRSFRRSMEHREKAHLTQEDSVTDL